MQPLRVECRIFLDGDALANVKLKLSLMMYVTRDVFLMQQPGQSGSGARVSYLHAVTREYYMITLVMCDECPRKVPSYGAMAVSQ